MSSSVHVTNTQCNHFNAQSDSSIHPTNIANLPANSSINYPSMPTGVAINAIDDRLMRIEELFMQEQEFIMALRTMRQLLQKPNE